MILGMGGGGAMLEAMAARVPVVVSNIPAYIFRTVAGEEGSR
jgi:glycosyltransferase involved in cell wall biosynthesis